MTYLRSLLLCRLHSKWKPFWLCIAQEHMRFLYSYAYLFISIILKNQCMQKM